MKKLQHLDHYDLFESKINQQFLDTFRSLFDRLRQQGIDATTLKKLSSRLSGNWKLLQQLQLVDRIVAASNLQEVQSLLDQAADYARTQRGKKKEKEIKTGQDIINLFPQRYHKTIAAIIKEEGTSDVIATDIANRIGNLKSAIDTQRRAADIEASKTFEEIEDIITRVELVSRANHWSDLAPSHLRKELKNRLEEFADIITDYDNYDDFRTNFMRKVNRYRDVDAFFEGIKNHIEGISDDYDGIVDKINSTNGIEVEKLLPDQIIAWIYSYDASKECGSAQWCISYSESMYNSYIFNEFRKQYFIWDFSYSLSDKESRIGITLKEDGSIRNAHFKNDNDASSYVKQQDWFKYLQPLSTEQTRKWIHNLQATGTPYPNFKTAALIAAELREFDVFKDALNNNIAEIQKDDSFLRRIVKMLIEKDDLEMLKIVGDVRKQVLNSDYGQPLILARQLKNKPIYDYIRNMISKTTVEMLKKSVAKKNPAFEPFLEAYDNPL